MDYRRKDIRAALDKLKIATPCKDCGKHYPPYVMDFDHVKGTKNFDIGNAGHVSTITDSKLQKEIAKCELVCANCHRIRTYGRRTNSKNWYLRQRNKDADMRKSFKLDNPSYVGTLECPNWTKSVMDRVWPG